MKNRKSDHDDHDEHFARVVSLDKTIFLFGEINPDSACAFLSALAAVDSTPGVVTVNVCSGGGWVEGGFLMYDAIRSTKNLVQTVASGAVYSAAVLPFMAGDLRLSYPSSAFLLHPMSLEVGGGTLGVVRSAVVETARMHKMYCDYISARSKMTSEAVALFCNRDTYLTAADAHAKGMVHKLIPYTAKKFQSGQTKKKK